MDTPIVSCNMFPHNNHHQVFDFYIHLYSSASIPTLASLYVMYAVSPDIPCRYILKGVFSFMIKY
jgi:hypothetical protein